MKTHSGLLLAFLVASPAGAQTAPSEQTTQLVMTVTEAFFDQIVAEDFAAERGFLSESLSTSLPDGEWEARRQFVIERAGATPRFSAHQLTYYARDMLLAAVDFSGAATNEDTYICGYVLWSLPAPNRIGLSRLEQNIIDGKIFRELPTEEAVQTMTNWQCPPDLIATVLDLSVQD